MTCQLCWCSDVRWHGSREWNARSLICLPMAKQIRMILRQWNCYQKTIGDKRCGYVYTKVDASGSKGKSVDMPECSDKGEDAVGSAQSSIGDKNVCLSIYQMRLIGKRKMKEVIQSFQNWSQLRWRRKIKGRQTYPWFSSLSFFTLASLSCIKHYLSFSYF